MADFYDVKGHIQHVNGTGGKDIYHISGHSGSYGWGITDDGLGAVIWNGAEFDVLHNIEYVQFSDGYLFENAGRIEYRAGRVPDDHDGGGGGAKNSPPVANDDATFTNFNESITVNVLANDFDPDGDPVFLEDFTDGLNGRVVANADGSLTYIPNDGFTGKDRFSYKVNDGKGGWDEAHVWVDVGPPPPEPPAPPPPPPEPPAPPPEPPAPPPEKKEIEARLVGDTHIDEGSEGWYRIELDHAVKEDTWFTIKVSDGSANRIDRDDFDVQNQDIIWGGSYTVAWSYQTLWGDEYHREEKKIEGRVPIGHDHEAGDREAVGPDGKDNWDYTVYDDDGRVAGDTVRIHVKAGEKVSDSFHVEAWKEKVTYDKNNKHVPAFKEEGKEDFHIRITDVEHGDHDWVKVKDDKLKVDIWDRTDPKEVDFVVVDQIICPVALDLDGDGMIHVTGETSSYMKDADAELGRTVQFDIDSDGDLETMEWFTGSGDGILIDNRDGLAAENMNGSRLFGDQGGKFENGYQQLALLDEDDDGSLSGSELAGIGLWVDDGDAIVEEGEIQTLDAHGIVDISVRETIVEGDDGREYIRSSATRDDGSQIMSEDVWFEHDESVETEPVSTIQDDLFASENNVSEDNSVNQHYNMEMRFFDMDYAIL